MRASNAGKPGHVSHSPIMLFLVKLFPEITIKSRPVRKRLVRLLRKNLKMVLKEIDEQVVVTGDWDCLEVETSALDVVQQGRMAGLFMILEFWREGLRVLFKELFLFHRTDASDIREPFGHLLQFPSFYAS